MPTKVAEYMARGVPVVTTPLPLAVELVEAADAGFVVPFNDPRRRRDAILKLDADPDLRVKMGLRGHEYAQANLAWPPHAAAVRRPAGGLGRRTSAPRPHGRARAAQLAGDVEEGADGEDLAHLGQLLVDLGLLLGQLVEFLLHGRAALVRVGLEVGE